MVKKFHVTYLPKSRANTLLSKRKLLKIKMKETDNPLKNAGEDMTKEEKLNYKLLPFPESFSHIVNIIDALPEKEKTVEHVESKLLLENNTRELGSDDNNLPTSFQFTQSKSSKFTTKIPTKPI
ncbi:hypothetical protein PR048_016047 [Dryococelus australis]|uniref:Uncharacterized protein n=1 Tax=Dryococelus australis TaxID=614101 RepID=A0ABQ9HIM5_9NEOP|nr:hypothetical protein PR048_016047 [Dryococelus australis]